MYHYFKMHTIYNISGTTYLEPNKEYSDETIYPNFQKDYRLFKETLKSESNQKINNTYYKFGDGDYLLFKNEKFGTTKPGVRDIKKSIKSLNIKEIQNAAQNHDKYFCEIINFYMFNEVLNVKLDFPAEYLYASVANKWFFKNFKKITLIGSETKLELINELMKFNEYREYLGIDNFHDLISIPQTGALSNSKKVYKKIKDRVHKSNPDIFLAGIGLSQNTLLLDLKKEINVPIVSIGSGIDAIAGVIDIYRPYYGGWVNYRMKNSNIYKKIKDPVLYTTSEGSNVIEI